MTSKQFLTCLKKIEEAGIRLNSDEQAIFNLRRKIDNSDKNENNLKSSTLPESVIKVEENYNFVQGSWSDHLGNPTFTNMELECGRLLYSLIGLNRPAIVLETGTHQGYSAAMMAQAMYDFKINGRIITIDPFDVTHLFENNALSDFVEWKNCYSTEIDEMNLPDFFDFIFLDSDHTYDTLSLEIELYEPMLKEGGVLVLHDTVVFKDLWPVVDSLKKSGRFEVLTLDTPRNWARNDMNGSGITVCRKIASGSPIQPNPKYKLNGNIDEWIAHIDSATILKSQRSVFFKT